MPNKGKVLLIVSQQGYQSKEYADTASELRNAGYVVETASITAKAATGTDSSSIIPDLAVKDANIDNYRAIVLIGGPGALSLGNHSEVLSLVRNAYSQGKIVAAICISPLILAKAGLLSGRQATVWCDAEKSQADELEEAGASFVDKPVVRDGNIITANGPAAAKEFGRRIAEVLG